MLIENVVAVADLINEGKDNAITLTELVIKTGLTERQVRKAIEIIRCECCVINNQDGKGYYIASNKSEAERYLKQEEARARTIFRRLRGTRKYLEKISGQEEINVN